MKEKGPLLGLIFTETYNEYLKTKGHERETLDLTV